MLARLTMLSTGAVALATAPALAVNADTVSANTSPIVIAHRGASGYRPEHTLDAYRYALLQGADFIEPDVVVTRDGALIARHENLLAEVALDEDGEPLADAAGAPVVVQATTDVADQPRFADRLAVKRLDGRPVAGWFSEDFTLEEIRALRARERMPAVRPYNRLFDDTERVPTLEEIITLVQEHERATGHSAGLYIEIKHPTYFLEEGSYLDGEPIGRDLGARVLATLVAAGFTDPDRLYLQSFEVRALLALKEQMSNAGLALPLVQLFGDITNAAYRSAPYDLVYHAHTGADLVALYGELPRLLPSGLEEDLTYADLATPPVLRFMAATYASAIGPPKQNVLPVRIGPPVDVDGDGRATQRAELTGEIGTIVPNALAVGLAIHPYTLRREEPFLVREGDRVLPVVEEARRLLDAGASGFFIDEPDEGRAAVEDFLRGHGAPTGSG